MHKKLESELISLAHQILKLKNKDDVFTLKNIAQEVYEKLSMLAFVEEYVNTTPNINVTKEALIENVEIAFESKSNAIIDENELENNKNVTNEEELVGEKVIYDLLEDTIDKPKVEPKIESKTEPKIKEEKQESLDVIEQPFDELEELMFPPENKTSFKNDVKDVGNKKTASLEEELQDTISVDVMADLFENAQPKSLNDKLLTNIQIGLNDRIAFVKHLFDGDQENYNRVISQLNTFKTEKETKDFIKKMVKPDYNWSEHEELENRFMEIVSRKFA